MKNTMTVFITAIFTALFAASVFAGEEESKEAKGEKKKDAKEWSKKNWEKKEWSKEAQEENLKNEISYLAQKLLDLRGEDNIEISQEPYTKPFLGVCSEVESEGVKLTCITPGQNAEAAGLRTGDMVVEINGASLVAPNIESAKKIYFGVLGSMKTGQKIEFKINRGGDTEKVIATVGKLSQPGYIMTIRRK